MTGYDQVLTIFTGIGLALILGAMWSLRELKRAERDLAAEKAANLHPAE